MSQAILGRPTQLKYHNLADPSCSVSPTTKGFFRNRMTLHAKTGRHRLQAEDPDTRLPASRTRA